MANIEKAKFPLTGSDKGEKGQQKEKSSITSPVVTKERKQEKLVETGGKELPEPIRTARKMPKLPPIGLNQVKDMLTKMPEKKIMEQVAVNLNSGAYHSDDSCSEMGMQGLFDCILETTLCSLDQSDSSHVQENSPRELPCAFCNKVFVSNLRLETHILVMHSHEDPSLLNVTHVAARRELHRSHSNSKTAGVEAADTKSRPLLEGLFNMELSQMGELDLVKHLPPKQRVKVSPKARSASKDQTESKSRKASDVSGDPTHGHTGDKITHSVSQEVSENVSVHPKVISSPIENSERQTSTSGSTGELTSGTCSSIEHEEATESAEPRMTRLRRRSSALPESSRSSSTPTTSSSSGERTRRSSHRQVNLNKTLPSTVSASKRKSCDTSSSSELTLEAKKPKTSGSKSKSGKQQSTSLRHSR